MKKIFHFLTFILLPAASFACHVGNKVWYDINRNGRQDSGEPGVSGVVIKVWKDADANGIADYSTPSYTATTNTSGNYMIYDMVEGKYFIQFLLPSGYSGFTVRKATGVPGDQNSKPYTTTGKTSTYFFDVHEDIDAGLVKNISIGDRVWYDVNKNGKQDAGEPGVEGAIVKLFYDGNGDNVADSVNPTATAITNTSGNYSLSPVTPGKYFVKFEKPSAYSGFTIQDAPGAAVGENSTANVTTGKTGTHNFTSNYTYKDAGLVKNIKICGKVYLDNNALTDGYVNGSLISSIDGVQLYANLFKGSTFIASQPIVDGEYSFNNLPGNTDYQVVISKDPASTSSTPSSVLPSGWVNTGERIGSGWGSDETVDGKINVSLGTSTKSNVRFGIQPVPESNTVTLSGQPNPGDTTSVVVPGFGFGGTDQMGGTLTSLRITSFPSYTDRLIIDGVVYNASTFPSEGVSVPVNAAGEPLVAIRIDPLDGNVTPVISYKVKDNGNYESANTGVVNVPFYKVADLTPVIEIDELNFDDEEEKDFVVNLFEINNQATSGPVSFRLLKPSGWDITVPGIMLTGTDQDGISGVSMVRGGTEHSNGNWNFRENANYIIVTADPGVVISGGSSATLGFRAKRKVTSAYPLSQNLTVTIIGGSGGEVRINNNIAITSISVNE